MSVIDTLICDRTEADVQRVTYLASKIQAGKASVEEVQEYLGNLKGSYNATDLNRVNAAMDYLVDIILRSGYLVPNYNKISKVWYSPMDSGATSSNVYPKVSDMQDYLRNLSALKVVFNTPVVLPESMKRLRVADANAIEQLLVDIDDTLKRIAAVFIRSGSMFAYAGTGWYIKGAD